jgi:hypothetical protein
MKAMQSLSLDGLDVSSMLNDPKFASMSGDLSKLQSSQSEMEKAGKELKELGIDPEKLNKKDSDTSNSSMSSLGLPPMDLIKTDKEKKRSILDGNDALLKLGSFKDLGIDENGEDKEEKKKREEQRKKEAEKKKEEEERIKRANRKLKNIDIINLSQAKTLLEILKQPSFFELLPQEAQKIVNVKYISNFYFLKKVGSNGWAYFYK